MDDINDAIEEIRRDGIVRNIYVEPNIDKPFWGEFMSSPQLKIRHLRVLDVLAQLGEEVGGVITQSPFASKEFAARFYKKIADHYADCAVHDVLEINKFILRILRSPQAVEYINLNNAIMDRGFQVCPEYTLDVLDSGLAEHDPPNYEDVQRDYDARRMTIFGVSPSPDGDGVVILNDVERDGPTYFVETTPVQRVDDIVRICNVRSCLHDNERYPGIAAADVGLHLG